MVVFLTAKMSELYQTSLSLLKVDKVKKSSLNTSSLLKSTKHVNSLEKVTINKLHYNHINYSENSKIYSKYLK